jgi:hypothetical protein
MAGCFVYNTAVSRDARKQIATLLRLTRDFEGLVVPFGKPFFILATAARARQQLVAARAVADTGDGSMAESAIRGLNESLLQISWLHRDLELAALVWEYDFLTRQLDQHEAIMKRERLDRQNARRSGQRVPPVAPGQSLGPLSRAGVREHRRRQKEIINQVITLPRYEKRLKRLRVTTGKKSPLPPKELRLPSFFTRAKISGLHWAYVGAYKAQSTSATHPNVSAILQYADSHPAGWQLRRIARGPWPDPYLVSLRLAREIVGIALAYHTLPASGLSNLGRLDQEISRLHALHP